MGARHLEAQAKARRRGGKGHGLGGVCTGDERRKKGLTRRGRAVDVRGSGRGACAAASAAVATGWATAWPLGLKAREGGRERKRGFFPFSFSIFSYFKTTFKYEPNQV